MVNDHLTIADIRRETSQPAHVINHALDRFGPAPAGRIGIMRIWELTQLPEIRESLRKTAARSTLPARRQEVIAS